jgi:hypothetical protein
LYDPSFLLFFCQEFCWGGCHGRVIPQLNPGENAVDSEPNAGYPEENSDFFGTIGATIERNDRLHLVWKRNGGCLDGIEASREADFLVPGGNQDGEVGHVLSFVFIELPSAFDWTYPDFLRRNQAKAVQQSIPMPSKMIVYGSGTGAAAFVSPPLPMIREFTWMLFAVTLPKTLRA